MAPKQLSMTTDNDSELCIPVPNGRAGPSLGVHVEMPTRSRIQKRAFDWEDQGSSIFGVVF